DRDSQLGFEHLAEPRFGLRHTRTGRHVAGCDEVAVRAELRLGARLRLESLDARVVGRQIRELAQLFGLDRSIAHVFAFLRASAARNFSRALCSTLRAPDVWVRFSSLVTSATGSRSKHRSQIASRSSGRRWSRNKASMASFSVWGSDTAGGS